LICLLLQPNPLNRIGSGSKGPLNNYTALKNHPFFEGIDFENITDINPPGINILKEVMLSAKSMKMINTESQSKKNYIINNYDNNFNNNPFEVIIEKNQSIIKFLKHNNIDHLVKVAKEGIVKKKSPWFHYNTRKIILDKTPKIEYIDPVSGALKV